MPLAPARVTRIIALATFMARPCDYLRVVYSNVHECDYTTSIDVGD